MTSAQTFAVVLFERLVHAERQAALCVYRAAGSARRMTFLAWAPAALWLSAASAGLLAVGAWAVHSVLLIAAAPPALRALVRARRRVIVEEFADFTDTPGVNGFSTLLVAELSRLRDLHGRVNDELSAPLSLGVTRRGAGGHAPEPGRFLTVRADDLTGALDDAVASDAKVQIGPVTVPVGLVLKLVGRIARGPRIVGSVHEAESGAVATAQLVGSGIARQWSVRASDSAPIVTELASQMFSDLTLEGSVRPAAMRAFTRHLELYWASHRTPRDRARNLRRAEAALLEAIAEDETFDLAYYNLGVIYSKLAATEHEAAQASAYLTAGDDPNAARDDRLGAAVVAFDRAVALNRDRAEAVYALAVHEYARSVDLKDLKDEGARHELLGCIVCRCDRVLELDPGHAQAYDLRGMALRQSNRAVAAEQRHGPAVAEQSHRRAVAAEQSHRRAVRLAWKRLRRLELDERMSPPALASGLPGARANIAAALLNLAQVQLELSNRSSVRRARADRLFRRAASLAPTATRAPILYERGNMLRAAARRAVEHRAAARCYEGALTIDPDHPVYWAALAAAYALEARTERDGTAQEARQAAERRAQGALHALAPIYRRTLEPHHPRALIAERDDTLKSLRRAYDALDATKDAKRINKIVALSGRIERLAADRDAKALYALKAANSQKGREWEREQVQIALARTLGQQRRWKAAADEYGALIALLREHRPQGIVQHSLHAKHARALRNAGKRHEALTEAVRAQLQDPLSPSARRELGKAHFALLHFDEALDAWRHALWLTPNDPHLHWKVGFCHWNVAQSRRDPERRHEALAEAAEHFELAAALFGPGGVEGWAWSRLWAGRARLELEDTDDAVAHLRAAAGSAPTELVGSVLLGELHRERDECDDAGRRFERARDLARKARMKKGFADADWGRTLTFDEVRARAGGLHALELDAPLAA